MERGLPSHGQDLVCVLQRRRRCFSAWLWESTWGVGSRGTSNLSWSSLKRKKEAICPESRRAMELLTATAYCDTGLPPVTIMPRRRSFYPQDQHREQISDLDLKGVKRQTGRRLGSNPHSIWPSECGKQRSQEQQRVAQLTARCQPPPTSVTPPACLVLS